MLASRVIPCLDIRDGRIVKGVRFTGLRDAGDPVESAVRYEGQGGDELVLLDVSATPEGRTSSVETVRAVREKLSIPLTVGGGVRTVEDVARLLEAGADKVGVNTAAVRRPRLVADIAERFGSQCTIVAVDAARTRRGQWRVVVTSGKEPTARDVVDWCREVSERGAGEILLTSWDRDGTREGYDTDLVAAVSSSVNLPVIASGGADRAEHLVEAVRAGASAALVASVLHYGEWTVAGLKAEMAAAGIEVRS